MEPEPSVPPAKAWQPLTPRGVAAFARASLSRLLVAQLAFALANGLALAWMLSQAVFPTVRSAINQLPDTGEVQAGVLKWQGPSPALLAEGRVVAVAIDMDHLGSTRVPSDFLLEFGRKNLRIFSIGGYAQWPYPRGYLIAANRHDLVPWWGAWAAPLIWLSCLSFALCLLLWWGVTALLLCGPVWVMAYFANRQADLRGCWRLSGAAMLPGSLVLLLAQVLYGTGGTSLVGLLLMAGLGLLSGEVYAVLAAFMLPREATQAESKANPFASSAKS